jgi:23S rRNA pseudouridine1911/1915/1917 synthase
VPLAADFAELLEKVGIHNPGLDDVGGDIEDDYEEDDFDYGDDD